MNTKKTTPKPSDAETPADQSSIELTQEDINYVTIAVQTARQGMADWKASSKIAPEKMRRPLTK